MDAKITKSRLSNLLSYDWMKIGVAILVAICACMVFFTMIRTMPEDEQTFTIYTYYDITAGDDSTDLADDLMDGAFSYEILLVSAESLTEGSSSSAYGNLYSGALYSTRIINTARTVMFVSTLDDVESEGYDVVASLVDINKGVEDSELHGFLDFETYLSDCEEYLTEYFGGDWENGALDKEKAEQCFRTRNAKDKRYRTEEKKAAGVLEEYDRFEKLREDYAVVKAAFGDETFSYSTVTIGEEYAEENDLTAGTYNCGVSLGKLSNLKKLYYYTYDTDDGTTVSTVSEMSMILFNTEALGDKTNDLRYETVSFLAYLLETYGV